MKQETHQARLGSHQLVAQANSINTMQKDRVQKDHAFYNNAKNRVKCQTLKPVTLKTTKLPDTEIGKNLFDFFSLFKNLFLQKFCDQNYGKLKMQISTKLTRNSTFLNFQVDFWMLIAFETDAGAGMC